MVYRGLLFALRLRLLNRRKDGEHEFNLTYPISRDGVYKKIHVRRTCVSMCMLKRCHIAARITKKKKMELLQLVAILTSLQPRKDELIWKHVNNLLDT